MAQIVAKEAPIPTRTVTVSTKPDRIMPKLAESPIVTIQQSGSQANQVVSTPENDTQTPVSAEPPKSDERMEALAKKEQMLVRQAQAMKAENAKIREELEQYKAQTASKMSTEEYNRRLLTDPTSLGLTYDQLGQLYLAQGDPAQTQMRQFQNKIAELEQKIAQSGTAQEQATKAAYDQALKQISIEAQALVAEGDAYEVVRSTNSVDAVVELIEATYKEEGVLMSVEAAAKEVEDYLIEQALATAKLAKIQAKIMPPAAEPVKSAPSQKQNTLTNGLQQASSGPLSAKDRRARAIEAFNAAKQKG